MLKKILPSLAALFVGLTFGPMAAASNLLGGTALDAAMAAGGPAYELTVVHINDHHSHLEPNTGAELEFDGVETDVETGGFPRVVPKIAEIRSSGRNVLTLHAGDAITGTIYYSLFKGAADAEVMNKVCFDAFALGNHEFDDSDAGLAQFLGYLNADPNRCQTPVLAANVIPTIGTPLRPTPDTSLIQPYVVKEVGGQRIGIIGIDIAGKTKNSSSPLDTTQFLDERETAQGFINELTAQGINKIILLTHFQYLNEVELAQSLRGVDAIVGGDSHTLLGERFANFGLNPGGPYPTKVTDLDGNTVCVVQAWQYADVVGELHLTFDGEGRVSACSGTPHLLLGDTFERNDVPLQGAELQAVLDTIVATPELGIVEPDPATQEIVDVYAEDVEVLKTEIVGVATKDFCLERVPGQGRSAICDVRATQANGGDIQQLVTEAYLLRSFEADVAIQNAGGVRIDIPAGDININLVYTLLPFANTLVNLEMSGAEIKQVLEEAVSNFQDSDGSTGSYPYAANLRWELDLSQPFGSRFSNIEIRRKGTDVWVPLQDVDDVTVVTNSFIAAGRDGYLTFGDVSDDGRMVDTYIDYAQAFIDYMQQDLGGAEPGDSVLTTPPLVTPPFCSDYSTQLFINENSEPQLPDAEFLRACE
ncbi:NAD nucleotidase [Lamprobacter modestohalophilus]